MVDLTPREAEAGLWLIHAISLGYGHDPPDGSVLDSLKRKLEQELERDVHQGQRGVSLA